MIGAPYQVLPLGNHNRAAFSCGKPSLDSYIQQMAGQDERADLSRCFVLVDTQADPRHILAYYTLTNTAVATHQGPEKTRKLRRYAEVGAVLLGRFAVDQSQQGKGLGRKLMLHILVQIARMSRDSGFQLLVVDPLDDEAAAFYGRFGFTALLDSSRMYLSLQDIRATLRAAGMAF